MEEEEFETDADYSEFQEETVIDDYLEESDDSLYFYGENEDSFYDQNVEEEEFEEDTDYSEFQDETSNNYLQESNENTGDFEISDEVLNVDLEEPIFEEEADYEEFQEDSVVEDHSEEITSEDYDIIDETYVSEKDEERLDKISQNLSKF